MSHRTSQPGSVLFDRTTPETLMQHVKGGRWFRVGIVLLLTSLPAGCSETSSSVDLAELDRWVAISDLRVGSLDDPDYSLTEFSTLAVGEAGRIYTGHRMESLVRIFEPDGTLFRTIGGQGEGPGEFQTLSAIGWIADSLWVLDTEAFRFSLFSEDGEFLNSYSIPFKFPENQGDPEPPQASGLTSDGTVHGLIRHIEGLKITQTEVVLMTREGGLAGSMAKFPLGNSGWRISDPDNPTRSAGTVQPYGDAPFRAFLPNESAFAVLSREAPTVAEDASFRLLKLNLEGDTVFSREYPFLPIPITAEVADSTLDHHVDLWVGYGVAQRYGITRDRLKDWMERTFYAPSFQPPISQMVAGLDGGFWLCRWPGEGDTVEWIYVDPAGDPKGRVDLPVGFRMLAGDSSTVWGSETDDFDVPYLVRFEVSGQGRHGSSDAH